MDNTEGFNEHTLHLMNADFETLLSKIDYDSEFCDSETKHINDKILDNN